MYNFPSTQLTGLNEQSNIIGKQIAASTSSAALTGEQPFVSGFSPIRGAAGTKVLLSGSGLNFIKDSYYHYLMRDVDDESNWAGYVAQILIYKRILSAQDVKQNYNAFKGRFGL